MCIRSALQKFEDEYESALKEPLHKKQKGERIERPKEPSGTNVVDLMDALRRSVAHDKRAPASTKKAQAHHGDRPKCCSASAHAPYAYPWAICGAFN
jgi:non-homologous end joining protein Ku